MRHNFERKYGNVVLKPLSQDESELYRKIRNQSRIRKWFGSASKISCEQQARWYREYLEKDGEYMFGILDSAGVFLGGCGIYAVNAENRSAEFGRIAIDEKFQGKGYGYQAVMAAVCLAREMIQVNVLRLEVKRNNIPACSIYQKAGFQITADRKDINSDYITMELLQEL